VVPVVSPAVVELPVEVDALEVEDGSAVVDASPVALSLSLPLAEVEVEVEVSEVEPVEPVDEVEAVEVAPAVVVAVVALSSPEQARATHRSGARARAAVWRSRRSIAR
jgi:hypothetical protein